ncbi:MAG: SH3 domain-containing protein [Chloroflexi bacterium]|nr:SH3 domain-containing protein [Chloroflexota bacterium]
MTGRLLALLSPALLLAACALPAQPDASPPGLASSAAAPAAKPNGSAAASASAAARVATVTGTGRFGLSIRKAPGLSADRIATVPDGFQANVTGGPVDQDGAQWFQLEGQGVNGWASGAYLTIAAPSASPAPAVSPASAATPATGSPKPSGPSSAASPSASGPGVPLPSAVSGLLASFSHETNYDVQGSGIFVEAPLKGSVDHLSGSNTGEGLLVRTAPVYLRITVGHFDTSSEGGQFSTLGHSIQIADNVMLESADVQSSILAHELQHASDILVDHMTPDTSQDCVNLELRAYKTEEKVWLELTKPSPPQTALERQLDSLSRVVDTPGFVQQLAQVYASECNAYGTKPPA